jgi:hypothetical protein
MPKGRDAGSAERDVDRLYGLPLDEFTSARNALARELKGSGDAAAATRVQKLAKPTRSAGAINRAVRQNRREAKRLLSSADKLREAQERLLRERGRRPVDQATGAERAAVDRLMVAVEVELRREGTPSPSMLERARDTLHAVATTPELREEFEAGRMTKDHKAIGFGALTPPKGAASAKSRRASEKSDARRRLRRAEQELEAAERRLERAESGKRAVEEQLATADAAVARSEQEVAEAAGKRDEAREGLERA